MPDNTITLKIDDRFSSHWTPLDASHVISVRGSICFEVKVDVDTAADSYRHSFGQFTVSGCSAEVRATPYDLDDPRVVAIIEQSPGAVQSPAPDWFTLAINRGFYTRWVRLDGYEYRFIGNASAAARVQYDPEDVEDVQTPNNWYVTGHVQQRKAKVKAPKGKQAAQDSSDPSRLGPAEEPSDGSSMSDLL